MGASTVLADSHLAHQRLHARGNTTSSSNSTSSSSTIEPITVKGNAFFKGDDRFYIRGVDYQPGGASKTKDPLSDSKTCKRDVKYFQKLGINTIRVYSVDNTADHDECMQALQDAGIYVILDVNTPKYSLNRADLKPSYNAVYLNSVFNIVQLFAQYNNTLAFFSGNEVVNSGNTTNAAPYIKAVTRDIKEFLKKRGLRQVPTGYSAADVNTNRLEMAEYMNCGSDEERSDFFAFNDYSWCDPSSFTQSGWDQKVKNFTGYGLPLFLSEYGCNTNTRKFEEVSALYSTKMTSVYSGGLVYEYSNEDSNYGLVDIDDDTVKERDDFSALKSAFEKTKNPTGNGGYNSTGGSNPCPKKDEPNWDVDPDEDIPSTPSKAKEFMEKGPAEPKGFSGGSQTAGADGGSDLKAGSGPQITGSKSSTSSSSSSSSSASATATGSAAGLAVNIAGLVAPLALGALAVF
ncbi:beta-glucanosyltransferase [Ascosphaera atra]|nr:beta-glucanosyltransferase [Ascosphaera atra]